MVSRIRLIDSPNASCSIGALSSGKGYLSCNVKQISQQDSSISFQNLKGTRPEECDNPAIADIDPMGYCSYRYSSMGRCGCPTLDPVKNPTLWKKYVDSVVEVVQDQLQKKSGEITLTFFASGYLLEDCQLLGEILYLSEIKSWKGTLTLQFVDLRYAIDNVQVLSENIQKLDEKSEINWGLILGAVTCGGLGLGAVFAASQVKKKEHKYGYASAGAILVIVAIVLGILSAPKEKKEKSLKDEHEVTQLHMNPSVKMAVVGFLTEVSKMLPSGIKLKTEFFTCAQDCMKLNRPSNAILGYDTEDSTGDFEALRAKLLNDDGAAILVTKEGPKGAFYPVFRMAYGPKMPLKPQQIE